MLQKCLTLLLSSSVIVLTGCLPSSSYQTDYNKTLVQTHTNRLPAHSLDHVSAENHFDRERKIQKQKRALKEQEARLKKKQKKLKDMRRRQDSYYVERQRDNLWHKNPWETSRKTTLTPREDTHRTHTMTSNSSNFYGINEERERLHEARRLLQEQRKQAQQAKREKLFAEAAQKKLDAERRRLAEINARQSQVRSQTNARKSGPLPLSTSDFKSQLAAAHSAYRARQDH